MWPGNRKAAISLTYDDGHRSNLEKAIPDLEEYGFAGTFYLSPGIGGEYDAGLRPTDWREALTRGHEIGNHTWSHPCDELSSPRYDLIPNPLITENTGRTEQWLNDNICFDDERTFAYTCGITELGSNPGAQARYLSIAQSTFLASRAGGGGPVSVADVKSNPHLIAANAATYNYDNADRAIAYCETAARTDAWAILVFHSITEGSPGSAVDTRRAIHRQILNHLAVNPSSYWVAPFRTVFRYIMNHR